MQIQGVSRFTLENDHFVYDGAVLTYRNIASIRFVGAITRHTANCIPSAATYTADLDLILADGRKLDILPDTRFLRGLGKEGVDGIQEANEILSAMSFTTRIERFEEQMETRDFFSYGEYQFHRSGELFRAGRRLFGIWDGSITSRLRPFEITFETAKSFGERLAAAFGSRDLTLDISTDRDCLLYMLKTYLRLSWKGERIREKRVNRRALYYETVLRFGAVIAMADGSADANELMQLKRFFKITQEDFPHAPRIFNEQLARRESVSDVLRGFATEFSSAPELKESFLVGMLSVALANGELHAGELRLIREAAAALGLDADALARVMAAAGLQDHPGEARGTRANEGWRGGRSEGRTGARAWHLKILGLSSEANQAEITQAYRAMVRRYHPDVLRGQGLPDDEITRAERSWCGSTRPTKRCAPRREPGTIGLMLELIPWDRLCRQIATRLSYEFHGKAVYIPVLHDKV
jgi:DnaJ like chaperone protein